MTVGMITRELARLETFNPDMPEIPGAVRFRCKSESMRRRCARLILKEPRPDACGPAATKGGKLTSRSMHEHQGKG